MRLNRQKFDVARAKRQINVVDLAKEARTNARYFSGSGPINVTVLAAGRLASALNVDLEDLLEAEGPSEAEAQ